MNQFSSLNNVKSAKKLVTKLLNTLGSFLVVVGKPFYYSLSALLILFLALIYIIRWLSKNSLAFLKLTIASIYKSFKVKQTLKAIVAKAWRSFVLMVSKIVEASKKLFASARPLFLNIKKKVRQLAKTLSPSLKKSLDKSKLQSQISRKKTVTLKYPKPDYYPSIKLLMFLLFLFFFSAIATSFYNIVLRDLPSATSLANRELEVSTNIFDRNGELLYKIYEDKNRTLVSLDDLPVHVKLATLAAEDSEFYYHRGFSVKGITRSIIKLIRDNEVTGGSTITQQLVKNTLLTPERTIQRKLKELTLAILVERQYSKDEILEMYLNEVSYGGTAYGIQTAAQVYFGKDIRNVNISEAALLAGLPKSPTKYSPHGPNADLAINRRDEILRLMVANGYISSEQRESAKNANLIFIAERTSIKAPHFVMYVRETLEEKYGKELVSHGGLDVVTTLDYEIQKLAETIVENELDTLARFNVGNGALIILDPQNGEILAMVGSRDYYDHENDGNVNVTTSLRQPGSSIKIVNYAHALSTTYTPATIINDSPITFNVDGQPPYSPKNYDGKFRGNLTLRSSLAESRNVPAVKVLSSYGVIDMMKMGKEMGITTWNNPTNYGLSLTLGGGDTKLIDLAGTYATVANYGKRVNPTAVIKITSHKGETISDSTCTERVAKTKLVEAIQGATRSALVKFPKTNQACDSPQALDPRVAYMLTDILKDNVARSPAFGSHSQLVIPGHSEVAVKTGTSNNLRDNLTIGYNQDYLVAVWVGNNDNSPMSRVASGLTGASSIWNKTMSSLLEDEDVHEWDVPDGLVKLPICTYTGTLACDGCPVVQEWFKAEDAPTKACHPDWFSENKEGEKPIKRKPRGRLLPEAASVEN